MGQPRRSPVVNWLQQQLIRQEIYAMRCCHQAIRILISHAADQPGIDPRRISFTRARDAVRGRISDPASFSPDGLANLAADPAFVRVS